MGDFFTVGSPIRPKKVKPILTGRSFKYFYKHERNQVMKWSTWFTKGGKQDDVDALSYTLVSGKGSNCAQKSLNEIPMWSTDYGGMRDAPCRDGG